MGDAQERMQRAPVDREHFTTTDDRVRHIDRLIAKQSATREADGAITGKLRTGVLVKL
ncbi:hypothetical protein [Burkholderia sp. 22313]|uniref:hypothetical protein n=1 Tax=Burkholderia sp. 22313 TaxID=3453908 RepID=UPI003F861069